MKKSINKYITLILMVMFIGVFALSFTACDNGNGGGGDDPTGNPPKVFSAEDVFQVEPADELDVHYSYTDGLFDYWFIYLGAINGVPISSQSTLQYNGQTPISLSFTSTTITQEAIEASDSSTVERSIETSISESHTGSVTLSAHTEAGALVSKTKVGIELGYEYNNTQQRTMGTSYSSTRTYTSFRSWQQENSTTVSFTVGEWGEAAGYYRLSLFTTSDLYATVIYDKFEDMYYVDYSSFARPSSYFLGIEYSVDNTFTSGNDEKAVFDSEIIDRLPPISEEIPETMTIYNYADRTNLNIGEVSIPATKTDVVFIGDSEKTYNMNIVIEPRNANNDLMIIFNNMKFQVPNNSNVHGIDGTAALSGVHYVYLIVYGNCSITGGNGGNTSGDAHASEGINVRSNNLQILGSGSLTITGGNGGQTSGTSYMGGAGGRGIYSMGMVSFDNSGEITVKGGNAGTTNGNWPGMPGGSGIVGMEQISFQNARGNISVYGGNGGDLYNSTYSAGNGGHALVTTNPVIESIHLTSPVMLYPGTGGTGYSASNGSNGQNTSETDNR